MMDVDLSGLQDHGVKGYIRFSIKAKDTKDNKTIHSDFKKFSSMVCNGDYTLALGLLMRSYEDRGMFEAMWEELKRVQGDVEELRTSLVSDDKVKDEDKDMNEAF
jgi:hypothetical protein